MSNPRRHPNEDPALEEVIRSMRDFVREGESEHLSEMSKARHRADLLALASSMSPQAAGTPSSVPSPSRWSWGGWQKKRVFGFAAALAVLVLVLNLSLSAFPFRRSSNVARLLVPAAQTAQAFALEPNQAFPGGIDPVSGWTLKASVPTSREAVERAIRIEPPVAVRVEKGETSNTWRLIPNEPLKDDAVYRVSLAASIQEGDREIPYEYMWAQQTVGTFTAESLSPAPRAGYVPKDAAIEATFSHEGFVDPAAYFEVKPAIEGRFETRGRTVVFLPNKPLQTGRVYQVRWKAGFGVKDTPSMQLGADIAYTFQVTTEEEVSGVNDMIYLPNELQVPTQRELVVPMNATLAEGERGVRVRLYPVSADEAVRYLESREGGSNWFAWSRARRADIAEIVKGKATVFDRELKLVVRRENGYTRDAVARVPAQQAGFYLLSAMVPGGDENPGDWMLVQVSDVAAHVQNDAERLVAWAVNAQTAEPISGAAVQVGDLQATSGSDGIASLALPKEFAMSMAQSVAPKVVRISANGHTTLVALQSYALPWELSLGGHVAPPYEGNRNTWVSLSIDRAIQRQSDTLNISGIAADRISKQAAPNLTLRVVTGGSYMPFFRTMFAQQTVLDEQRLMPDAAGRFTARFSWKDRATGYYTVQLLRDGAVIGSQAFEIRQDAKPTTKLLLTMDRMNYFAGDTIKARVTVQYMDGTRYPNANVGITFSTNNHDTTGQAQRTVKTDARGIAELTFPTRAATPCRFVNGNQTGVCYGNTGFTIEARLQEASEGEAASSIYGTIYSSAVQLTSQDASLNNGLYAPRAVVEDGKNIRITGRTVEMSIAADDAVSYVNMGSVPVDVDIFERFTVQTQIGTSYDPISKVTVPVYSYAENWRRVASEKASSADQGVFSAEFSVERPTSSYVALLRLNDRQGRSTMHLQYVETPYIYTPSRPIDGGSSVPTETPVLPKLIWKDAKTGDKILDDHLTTVISSKDALRESIGLRAEVEDLPVTVKRSRPMYTLAARGLVDTVVTDDFYRFTMNDRLLPNATITAVVYTQEGFMERSLYYNVAPELFELKVKVTRENEASTPKPGETVKYSVRVTNQDGVAVPNTQVVLSVADSALESLGAFWSLTNPVQSLYSWRDTGILATASTHKLETANAGAEGGGGGDGTILNMPRKDFKDQAVFLTGTTDAAGTVSFDVTLPDNITTWRVETRAMSANLEAGWEVSSLSVRKPIAIDAAIPKTLAVGDAAQMKLSPMSNDLAKDTVVEYVVDAPGLGIKNQGFTARGYDPVYVPITVTEQMRGTHTVRVGLRANGQQDAMEFAMSVADQVPTKTIWEQADAAAGFRLPDTTANQGSIVIASRARAALLPAAQTMVAWLDTSPRLELVLADRMARALVAELGGRVDVPEKEITFSNYQAAEGFAPLVYSSPDVDTSLEVAFSGLEVGDKTQLAAAFQAWAQAKDARREVRIKAVSGLALLGKPVLNALQEAGKLTDLTREEESVLLRTYVTLGMRNEAQVVFDRWMTKAEERDGGIAVKVGSSDRDYADSTRAALQAAYLLRDTRREGLRLGWERMSASASFRPVWDAQILSQRIAQAPNEAVTVKYKLGEETFERNLNDGSLWLNLSAEEWKRFSIESVTGNAVVQWQRRVPGVPQSTPGMSLERSYRLLDGTGTPKEGDLVQISLRPRFSPRDTYGCYEIRDRLPANLAPVLDWTYMARGWYPSREDDGSVSFIACAAYQDDMTYTARVIAPGTYTAPAPVMQNVESPSLATMGTPTAFRADKR